MANLEHLTGQLRARVANGGLDRTVKFDLQGEGLIYLEGSTVTNEDRAADCTIVLAGSDFESLAGGQIDGTSLYMTGRMRIKGDISVAMMLQPIIGGE